MPTLHVRRIALACLLGVILVAGTLVLALPASAANLTLRLFSVEQTSSVLNASGKPVSNAEPAVGEIIDVTDLDYSGSHSHHGKNWVGSDHLHCTITAASATSATGLCNGQFAIGGSLLLSDDVTITFTPLGISPVLVNEGTGKFRGLHGTILNKNIGTSNNADVTIKLSSS